MNLASENNWDTTLYEECSDKFLEAGNQFVTSQDNSPFNFDDKCPFIQCAGMHSLASDESRQAFRDCVQVNAASMTPGQLEEPVEIVDSCDNYSEAWGECECWNDHHLGCNYNIPGFQRFPDLPEEQGTVMLLITNSTDPLEDQAILAEPGKGNFFDMDKFDTFNPNERTILIIHGYNQV